MASQQLPEHLTLRGELVGHGGWVTAIATTYVAPDLVISSSRDKTIIVWDLAKPDQKSFGVARKRLVGHGHFVQDVALSSDGHHALSGSWDGSLRLWNLETGETRLRFVGHTKDVLSVAFSQDDRQIVSGSRDRTIRLWNTLGRCKKVFSDSGHKEWVSCVRFSPNVTSPLMVSAGWDKVVKVWNLSSCTLRTNLLGHTGFVSTVTVSPDGSLCASGGKDGTAMLWDLSEGRHLSSLDAFNVINALIFSPVRYWLCAATADAILIWDLESKVCLDQIKIETREGSASGKKAVPIQCISLCWSPDGQTLFAGCTDNVIRCYQVSRA